MQFRHPEILYALFALLVPVIVHLFQLQRFTKVPFTNVELLKRVQVQSRKSSRLKRFLVLLSRMLAIAALVLAFAGPEKRGTAAGQRGSIHLFADNSISMTARDQDGSLWNRVIRELLEYLPEGESYSLETVNDSYTGLDINSIKQLLKNLHPVAQSPSWKSLALTASTSVGDDTTYVWISDFQYRQSGDFPGTAPVTFIPVKGGKDFNISIDTVFIKSQSPELTTLSVRISCQGNFSGEAGISAYSQSALLAKTSLNLSPESRSTVEMAIPTGQRLFDIRVDADDRFEFDNIYRVSLPGNSQKINVLNIGKNDAFLKKIFTPGEFSYRHRAENEVSYELLTEQNLIILNRIDNLPPALADALEHWLQGSRTLVIIPSGGEGDESLNRLYGTSGDIYQAKTITDTLLITGIRFSHPLFKNVFEKKTDNFNYPKVYLSYPSSGTGSGLPVLELNNGNAFVSEIPRREGKIYTFYTPLTPTHTGFLSSPLIVPLFYNMGKYSAPGRILTYRTGSRNKIDIPVHLSKDEVLKITAGEHEWIPPQEILADKTVIDLSRLTLAPGYYQVEKKDSTLSTLAVNPPVSESSMRFYRPGNAGERTYRSVKEYLTQLRESRSVKEYYPLFTGLSLLFLIIEFLILKYYKAS